MNLAPYSKFNPANRTPLVLPNQPSRTVQANPAVQPSSHFEDAVYHLDCAIHLLSELAANKVPFPGHLPFASEDADELLRELLAARKITMNLYRGCNYLTPPLSGIAANPVPASPIHVTTTGATSGVTAPTS